MTERPDWYEIGKSHIWHPYTQHQTASDPVFVASAKGSRIILSDGTELIDGISSWWSSCHGFNHPHIRKAVKKQLNLLPHFMFAGAAHEPAYLLAEKLSKLTGLDRAFFTDSGSTAIETAMKIAVQYWKNKSIKNRTKFVTFTNSYHGDTMGAMSLCDPTSGMHRIFNNYMPMQFSVDIPHDEYRFAEFDDLLGDIRDNVAAVILEPLVQGAGGMKFHSADVVAEIYRIAKKHDILFIADEIMTGFGRTGTMFACHEAAIKPDIMCLGKALTGGTMTLAAVMCEESVFSGFMGDALDKALMSGPTYMANPLACSAALASIELFEKYDRIAQIQKIETQLYEELKICKALSAVKEVRVKGAIGVVELHNKDIVIELRQKFKDEFIWLRPFSNVVYVMPPFIISSSNLSKITKSIYKLLSSY